MEIELRHLRVKFDIKSTNCKILIVSDVLK